MQTDTAHSIHSRQSDLAIGLKASIVNSADVFLSMSVQHAFKRRLWNVAALKGVWDAFSVLHEKRGLAFN
jgi:hypothetical protein